MNLDSADRQRRRLQADARDALLAWFTRGYQVLWVTLTSGPDAPARSLMYQHRRLLAAIHSELEFEGVQYLVIETGEGNGVLHIFWAWRPGDGERRRSFYIPQGWLSDAWKRIHFSPVVWINRVDNSDDDASRLSRYCAAQYCAGQNALVQYRFSRRNPFGRGLGRVRREVKLVFNEQWHKWLPRDPIVWPWDRDRLHALVRERYGYWECVWRQVVRRGHFWMGDDCFVQTADGFKKI